MRLFQFIKAVTRKKVQPKDYNEPSLFDELTDFYKQNEPAAGQTKTVDGKTYTLQPSSHPGWLRWKAQDGSELVTDEEGNEVEQKPKSQAPKPQPTPKPEPLKEPEVTTETGEEFEEDLFGNRIYRVGSKQFALIKKEDGKTTLTRVPEAKKAPEPKQGPETEDLFSQINNMIKKPKEAQKDSETVQTPAQEEKAPEKPQEEETDPFSQTVKDETAGKKPEIIQYGAEGLKGGKKTRQKEREKLNKAVRELLERKINRYTDDEKRLLAQYSGKGGTDELSLNEYYSTTEQSKFIWDCVRQLGFRGGSAIEPSCATGVFIHTAPDDTVVTGVELDPTSAKISQILHGDRHEIHNMSFELYRRLSEDELFDLVIGNTPFGPRGKTVMYDGAKKHLNNAEQYFLERGMDKLRENGILAMIVPTGIMDAAANSELRNELNKQAEFLGAFRLPTGAFHHAHAEVTTDIVFFRKRPTEVSNFLVNADPETISKLKTLGFMDHEFTSGRFFEKNPEYTMGIETKGNFGRSIWKGEFNIEELREKAGLLKPHRDNYDALKEFGIDITREDGRPAPKVGEVRVINGRQYLFNKNHRWERISDDSNVYEALNEDEQKVADELGINAGEFQKIRKNIILEGIHLTDEQRNVFKIPGTYDHTYYELESLVNIPLGKLEKCRKAALIGLAIQEYERMKRDPSISRDIIWSTAKRLEGEIGNFISRFGNPADLVKYLDKGKRKGIQTLYASVDEQGVISGSITDPFKDAAEASQVKTKRKHNDLTTPFGVVKELFETGEEVDYDRFNERYRGEERFTESEFHLRMLNDDSIGITDEGFYAPEKEVYVGQVTDKIDSWSGRIKEIDEELQAQVSGSKVEELAAEKNKLESQLAKVRELAGYKGIEALPVKMGDARRGMFDISLLNDYLKEQGLDMELEVDYHGKINFTDSLLAKVYELYHDKGDLTKEGQKSLKKLLEEYYAGNKKPLDLVLLNSLNGIPNGRIQDEIKLKLESTEQGFKQFLSNREEAADIAEQYNRQYNNWIMKNYDEEVIEGIQKLDYDKKLNRFGPDGKQLTIRESIAPNQWGSIRRLVDQGKGMLAHGVGVGKTLQAIVSIAIMKQEGKCTKPLVVTPKSVLLNWNEESNLWLKDANVLVVGYKKDKNGRYTIQESNGEIRGKLIEIQRSGHKYDLILMARDTFSGLDFASDTKERIVNELVLKFFESESNLTKDQLKKRASLEQKFAKEVQKIRPRFEGLTFEELGVDLLVRDESHDVKNLLDTVTFQDIKGLSGASSSRSLHNYIASNIIRQQNGGRNVIMLTATPISNTPLEIFNMMLPFAEDDLSKMGVSSIDDFIGRFAQIDHEPTTEADGSIVNQAKFVGWSAGEVLRKLFFRFVDYKTHKDVKGQNIRFPKENPIHEFTTLNEGQKALLDHCRLRLWANRMLDKKALADLWESGEKFTGNIESLLKKAGGDDKENIIKLALKDGALTEKDIKEIKAYASKYVKKFLEMNSYVDDRAELGYDGFFKIQSDMIKATADLSWYKEKKSEYAMGIDDDFVQQHTSYEKLDKLTNLVSDEYKNGGKQVIFAINVNLHEKIKDSLVKAGVKPEEIIIVNGETVKGSDTRLQVSNDFNAGKYKVVIGNYATMGEGLNFNNGTTKGYHLQPPWNSLQYEQGNGRFIRQGNPNESVDVHYFLSKGSIDAFMNQKVLDKKDMVDKFLRGETNEWEDDIELSPDDMLIELARSPEEAKRLVELKQKNQERVNAEYEAKTNIRKLQRYHNNLRYMKDVKDKTSPLYERLRKENENFENEFNSTGHRFSQFLDKNRSYIIDEKSDLVIPEGSLLSSEDSHILIKNINTLSKTCQTVNMKGEVRTISIDNLLTQMKGSKAKVNISPGDVLFRTMLDPDLSVQHLARLAGKLPGDIFSPDQISVLKKSFESKLEKEMYIGDQCYFIDTNTDQLTTPRSWDSYSQLKKNGIELILPSEEKFFEAVRNTDSKKLQELSTKNSSFTEIYVKLMRSKFPTMHQPPVKMGDIETLYKEAHGYSDSEYEAERSRKKSKYRKTVAQEIKDVYSGIKEGDYSEYADLLADKISREVLKYDYRTREVNLTKKIEDPNIVDQLNFIRAYDHGWRVRNVLSSIDEAVKKNRRSEG